MEVTRSYSEAGESSYLGVYSEVWWNYMDAEYYRDELKGLYRVLLEEELSQTVSGSYMAAELKKIGVDVKT